MIYIGIDDTDTLESRGTGNLARQIASAFSRDFKVHGVVRHQLFKDDRVPYTSHNSSAAILLSCKDEKNTDLERIFNKAKDIMLSDFQQGSDPGLCVVNEVPEAVTAFGHIAKKSVVNQQDARSLAAKHGIMLEGLGGTEDGVIGALAAVGLSACGNDGRYVMVGSVRELTGQKLIDEVLTAGVKEIRTMRGELLSEGIILTDKLRPARRGFEAVSYVEWGGGCWLPVKLD